jgi:acyl carrier protein
VVLAREEGAGEKRLIAYLVGAAGEMLTAAQWRSNLRERLPEYMIPAAFVTVETMPLTSNGKADRRALLTLEEIRPESDVSYEAPRTMIEQALVEIWAEVLRTDHIGIRDNFFILGGHSLAATRVISRIRDAFQIEMPLRLLFDHPTIADLGKCIEDTKQHVGTSAPFAEEPILAQATETLEDILEELASLSDEDTRSLLGIEA